MSAADDEAVRIPPRWVNRVVITMLSTPLWRLMPRSIVLLRFTGRRSGRQITLPVQHAMHGSDVVIYVAAPRRKNWWRSFDGRPRPLAIRRRGRVLHTTAATVRPGDPVHAPALAAYRAAMPKSPPPDDALLVVARPENEDAPASRGW